jgi:leader peptidase (prepilin peptidase)/N-methyltransferase
MIVLVLIILGLIFGSFVNALVWRVHAQAEVQEKKRPSKKDAEHLKRLSISRGRSMCKSCGHELAAKDLVPINSWLSLSGKCRYCGAAIPDTPLAELLVPVVFVASYLWWPWVLNDGLSWLTFAVWLLSAVALVALALYDLKWYILPNRIVFPLIGLSFTFRIRLALQSDTALLVLASGLWGILVLAGLFYLLYIVSNEQWIGGGDVKLAVALGLLSGGPLAAMLLLFVASFSGTLAAVPLIIRGKQARGLKVPFGPFLILATVITVLFASPVLDWYTHLFVG